MGKSTLRVLGLLCAAGYTNGNSGVWQLSHVLQLRCLCLQLSYALNVLIDTSLCDVQLLMSSVDLCLQVYQLMLQFCNVGMLLCFLTQQLLDLPKGSSVSRGFQKRQ